MTENNCPSTSPESKQPCILEDTKAAHKQGHESARGIKGDPKMFVSWWPRNEDWERWDNEGGAIRDDRG